MVYQCATSSSRHFSATNFKQPCRYACNHVYEDSCCQTCKAMNMSLRSEQKSLMNSHNKDTTGKIMPTYKGSQKYKEITRECKLQEKYLYGKRSACTSSPEFGDTMPAWEHVVSTRTAFKWGSITLNSFDVCYCMTSTVTFTSVKSALKTLSACHLLMQALNIATSFILFHVLVDTRNSNNASLSIPIFLKPRTI